MSFPVTRFLFRLSCFSFWTLAQCEDPENLPEGLEALCGKTFQFVIAVDKANLGGGHSTYKVVNVLSALGIIEESEALTDSARDVTPSELLSGEQVMHVI